MNKAVVCIPWRTQLDRAAAHQRVTRFWKHFGYPIVHADSGPGPFHLARARNRAVRKAGTGTVIIADADTIPDIAAIKQALDSINDTQVIYPHNIYRHIPAAWTNEPDLHAAPIDHHYVNSTGGVIITTSKLYWQLGGMDERFNPVWGYEDNAFFLAAQTLAKTARIKAVIYSFNHPVDGGRDITDNNPNKTRYQLYRTANHNPAMMRELLK